MLKIFGLSRPFHSFSALVLPSRYTLLKQAPAPIENVIKKAPLHTSSSCSNSTRSYIDLSLYLIANRASISDPRQFLDTVEEAVEGGVTCVQYRDDSDNTSEVVRMAFRLKRLLDRTQTPLIINTRTHLLQIAYATQAEGIYLEQPPHNGNIEELLDQLSSASDPHPYTLLSSQFNLSDPRRMESFCKKLSIGIPVTTQDDIFAAAKIQIDYLSVKIAPSLHTNPGESQIWGIEGLEEVCHLSPNRVVAVGNITLENASEIYEILGPKKDGLAVAGALLRSSDPCKTAQAFRRIREEAIERKMANN